MIEDNLLLILSLLFAVSMLSMLARKLGVSYPIFLVIAGLIIGFFPGMPGITLNPDIVFLIFLPPLLYSAAWNTSWKDFWAMRRPISLLSIGLVIFTSTAVAFLSNALIPGFPLAYGFLLGGIISPPDAVAATSVLQGLKIPKRVVVILEGESLVNDASSLIVFRFALAAIFTGQFTLWKAATDFVLVAGLGLLIGIAIGFIIYIVHKFLPTTPSIDTGLTLITPYIMYIAAEHFHYSGVMSVVGGGLFLTYRAHEFFGYNSRIQAYSVWETFVFLLNGMVFILIGLQLPQIVNGMQQESQSPALAVLYGLVISVMTVIIRIIWVFPGAYLPRILNKNIRTGERRPSWKGVFLVAWSGMRGVVSLAAALAIPLSIPGGQPFPYRSLLLFITFIVILFTLVLQGLSLPWIIKKLDMEEEEQLPYEQDHAIKLRMAESALEHIEVYYEEELKTIDAYQRLRDKYQRMVEISSKAPSSAKEAVPDFLPRYRKLLLELVAVKRYELNQIRNEKTFSDELILVKERELDLEEARLRELDQSTPG